METSVPSTEFVTLTVSCISVFLLV